MGDGNLFGDGCVKCRRARRGRGEKSRRFWLTAVRNNSRANSVCFTVNVHSFHADRATKARVSGIAVVGRKRKTESRVSKIFDDEFRVSNPSSTNIS